MIKKMLPLIVILAGFSACAQSPHLDEFYRKYQSSGEGTDGLSVDPGFLFSASFSGKAQSGDKDWMRKITSIRCLIIDAKSGSAGAREWSDLGSSLRADGFEEWVGVRKGKSRFQLLSRDGKADQKEIACLIVGDDGGGLFFHLRGHFTDADKARIEAALQSHDSE